MPRRHLEGRCEYDDYIEDLERWETRTCDAWEETLDGHTYQVYFERDNLARPWPARQVPAGEFFVLGDNRDNSHDSRYWGFLPPNLIKGRITTVLWSSGRAGGRPERRWMKVP